MKLKSLLFLAFAALLFAASPRTARAADVSFDFFYDSLSPYGDWIEVGDYGYCWRPSGVDEDWAPYSDGYWAYTDAGWTWVSYEDYGGIVYHYGRWAKVEEEGWVWVPDYEWGPAWVSWRRSDDYVGWAPLPAEARWQRDRGFSVWVDTSYDIGPSYYNFCRVNDFGAPVLRPVILRRSENFVIIGNTVNITNISYNRGAGCAFNGGLDYAYMNRFARRPIPALKLVRNNNVTIVNNTIVNNTIVNNNVRITNYNAVQRGNQLTVISPNVTRPAAAQLATIVKPKRVIPQSKVVKGWSTVPTEQREALKAKFAQQSQGMTPENTPAKAVQPAELKMVPVKADPKAKIPGGVPAREAAAERTTPPATNAPAATPAAIAGKPVKRPGRNAATPMPEAPVANMPTTTTETPVTNERPQKVRPGITKPFNAAPVTTTEPGQPATTTNEPAAVTNPAVEKRNEAAAKRAAAQQQQAEDAQQRGMLQQQKEQEAVARRQAAQQEQQQLRQNQQEAIERKQAAAQENQAAARQRAAEAAQASGAREQAMEAQKAEAAEAAAARREAVERAQAQRKPAAPQQQEIQQMPARQVQPPAQAKQPARANPKRPLSPEEAAKMKEQQ